MKQKLIRSALTLTVLAIAMLTSGCVHRRVTIRTDPPGAQVLVGGEEIGYSPASFDITWYGTEEVTLLKDGYEIETQYVKIPRPWYQVPPLDFVTDNFLLTRTKDQHDFTFPLTPQTLVPRSDLVERGNAFRSESQLGQ
ncbi:MAG: PEGA domain-containing protein [Planctomycetota bacterium]|nr:PEGA domain-containing protein [Planctomycetota bacterium]MDA1252665.1 PEGA domain-containing protein [Planctomycetota bacterium]